MISRITEAIKKREGQPERADNPVHDTIPQLPINNALSGDEQLRVQLRNAQETMEQLHRENDRLSLRLEEIAPSDSSLESADLDVDELLDKADGIMKSTGQHALLRLRQAIEDMGADAFVKELRAVLRSPYLDEDDFMEIVVLCKQAGLDDHRRATLEVARRRYPYSTHVFIALVDALDDSPNLTDQERGRLMLEERLGIEHKDGTPRFKGTPTSLPFHEAFAILFNFYNRAEKNDWILALTDSLPDSLTSDPLMRRNRARAFAKLNRPDEAQSAYEEALALDPTDDQTLAWFANFLDDEGNFAEAYATYERAILLDPEDGNLLLSLAIHMLNRGYYRGVSERIEGPIPRKARARIAVPMILKALEVGGRSGELLQKAVRILVRGNALREAQAIASGQDPEGRFDTAPVDYLLSKIRDEATEEEIEPTRLGENRDEDDS